MSFLTRKIFGTPPEPYFNAPSYKLSDEALEEALWGLADENDIIMFNHSEEEGHFKVKDIAEFIFFLCKKWKQPHETKYLAVEIFDRFMQKHLSGLYNIVKDSPSKQKLLEWKAVQNRIKLQLPLRMTSCVQIASKLVSHRKSVRPDKSLRFLESTGQRHSVQNISKSELRVLQTLNFKLLTTSPLSYVEIILEILVRSFPAMKVKILHTLCVTLLDGFYIKRMEIFGDIIINRFTTPDINRAEHHPTAGIENNAFLVASAVIVAAASIIDETESHIILQSVSSVTQISEDDIAILSKAITMHIIEEDKPRT